MSLSHSPRMVRRYRMVLVMAGLSLVAGRLARSAEPAATDLPAYAKASAGCGPTPR